MAAYGFPQKSLYFFVLVLSLLATPTLNARDFELAPGEAFVTRFSGTTALRNKSGETSRVLNLDGVVGSLIDLRFPGHKPTGQHWRDEPQSFPVYARQTGQVFGIAFDNATPANIFLTATSAFGLYRTQSNDGWMPGMWGRGGGPGTVYKLDAQNGYKPEIFANIRLNGRENAGASLGNIAFDERHNQLLVSDLQTGMIHRLDVKTGRDLGHYDHGGVGRGYFFDAARGHDASLVPVFVKRESPHICRDKKLEHLKTPECWRYTAPQRRIWGLGIRQQEGTSRLFYAVWDRSARSQIWSIAFDDKGAFNTRSIRREFIVPASTGKFENGTPAITDIAFSGDGRMLLAERGAPRRTKIVNGKAVTAISQARVLQYRLLEYGAWMPQGIYAIGNRNSAAPGENARFNNAAGGVSFGYGRSDTGSVNLADRAGFVWASGDGLCSPTGPCLNSSADKVNDTDFVTGIEGRPASLWAANLARSYKIDTDINISQDGQIITKQALRNDDSYSGDIEIYQPEQAAKAPATSNSPQISTAPAPVQNRDGETSTPVDSDVRALILPRRKPATRSITRHKQTHLKRGKKHYRKAKTKRRKKTRWRKRPVVRRKSVRRATVTIFSGGRTIKRVVVPVR